MSLLATAIGVISLATGKSKSLMEDYIAGIDALGAIDADAKANGSEVHVHTSSYWTSVAAGLTVAGLVFILNALGTGRVNRVPGSLQ